MATSKKKTPPSVHKAVRLPTDLYEQVEYAMEENDWDFTELTRKALEFYIAQRKKKTVDKDSSFEEKKSFILQMMKGLEPDISGITPDRETRRMDPKEHKETEAMHRAEMKRLEEEAETSGHKPIPTTKIRRTQGTPRSPSMGKKKQA